MNSKDISLPQDFMNRMKTQLQDGFDDFAESYGEPPLKAVRMNRLKIRPEGFSPLAARITGSSAPEEVSWWQGAYYYEDTEPGKSPLHDAGAYYIQEPSAMFPVTLLDIDDSGMKVLDLCAAPGGKTSQIADLMKGHGLLVPNEIIPGRASVLSENVERMGIVNALVTCADPKELADRFPAFFDRILVDAPCSGEGMFRKNPEAVSEWSPENVKMCAGRQKMLLECAYSMLAPGGRIVYSTCTFSPEEDDETIATFLRDHPDFTLCSDPVHIYPHTHRGEGHFAAALERGGDAALISTSRGLNEGAGNSLPVRDKKRLRNSSGSAGFSFDNALLCIFLDETLRKESPVRQLIKNCPERLLPFGDSLYLAPEHMPADLKGLKIKRAGLKLGCFKKNRFEPDHALSHALTYDDVVNHIDLDPDGDEIRNYLAGSPLACSSEIKGWCLVGTAGSAAGWGKASSGTVKNHYPSGLRKTPDQCRR